MNYSSYPVFESYRGGENFNTTMRRTNMENQVTWPNFQQFCAIRDFVHMDKCEIRCPVNYLRYEDSTMDYLRSMENQWQYLRRSESNFSIGNTSSFQNVYNSRTNMNHQGKNDQQDARRGSANSFSNINTFYLEQKLSGKRKLKRSKKSSNIGKPKRPLTSFMLFLKDYRTQIVSSLPAGSSSQDINRAAGKSWHALSESEKEKYKKHAAEALKKWKVDNGEIKDSKDLQVTNQLGIGQPKPSTSFNDKKSDDLLRSTSPSSGLSSSSSDSSSSDEE